MIGSVTSRNVTMVLIGSVTSRNVTLVELHFIDNICQIFEDFLKSICIIGIYQPKEKFHRTTWNIC